MGIYLSPLQRIVDFTIAAKNYLESGFLDLLSTGQCTADGYRPAHLYFNATVSGYLSAQATPLQGKVTVDTVNTALTEYPFTGETIADGAESKSVGCASKQLTITVGAPCDTTYTGGGFCDAGLLIKKQTIQKVPGSLFTGKLRLYVQSIYGSTRSDYTSSGMMLNLDDGEGHSYSINPNGDSSTWLLTLINGGYALCKKNGTSLEITPLILTAAGQQFATILSTHADKNVFAFSSRVEAYILAYAKPDPANKIIISITGAAVQGAPLAYGWHSNWPGNEAHMVAFYAAATADRFTSNQYKLTITQTESAGGITFAAAITVTESGKDWANWSTGINLFYYDELTMQMRSLAKPGGVTPAQFTFDAPVYCFMMLNPSTGVSDLVTVRVYYTLSGTAGQLSIIDSEGYSQYRFTLDDYWAAERTISYGTKADGGIKTVSGAATVTYKGFSDQVISGSSADCIFVGGKRYGRVPVRPNNYYGAPGQWFDPYGWNANDSLFEFYQRPHPSGSGTQFAFLYAEFSYLEVESYNKVSTARSFSAYVETFFGDADAVNFGVCQTKNNSSSLTVNRTSNPMLQNSPYQIRDMGMMEAKYDATVETFLPTGTWLHKASDTINVYCQPMGNVSFPIGYYGNPPSGGSNIVKETAGLNYTTDIKEIVDSKTPETALKNSSNGDSRYFAPTLSSPGTGTIDNAMSSIQSGAKSTHTLYSKDYGFIKNASIGWA